MNKANESADVADQDSEYHQAASGVTDLYDCKQKADLSITFAFNKYMLTARDQQGLSNLTASTFNKSRYFLALEGFTDQIGRASTTKRSAASVLTPLPGAWRRSSIYADLPST
jgi:outer membrane protein OmpA-like peptidoglycan-associated protein